MNCNNYNTIRVTAGNAFSLLLPLKEKQYVSEQPIEEVINAALLTDVQVLLNNEEWSEFELGEDGVLVRFPSTLSKGVYNIELTAKYGGVAIRAAYFQCLSIVAWSYQADAENYIPTSPIVADAAFIISVKGDEELTALKEQYRDAIAATEAEKAEYERKVAELNGVAQEESVKEVLNEVSGIGAVANELQAGKQAIVDAIAERGVDATIDNTLTELAAFIPKLAIPVDKCVLTREVKNIADLIGSTNIIETFYSEEENLWFENQTSYNVWSCIQSLVSANKKSLKNIILPNNEGRIDAERSYGLNDSVVEYIYAPNSRGSSLASMPPLKCIDVRSEKAAIDQAFRETRGKLRHFYSDFSQCKFIYYGGYYPVLYDLVKTTPVYKDFDCSAWGATTALTEGVELLNKDKWDDPNEPTDEFKTNRDKFLWYFEFHFMPCLLEVTTSPTLTLTSTIVDAISVAHSRQNPSKTIAEIITDRGWTIASY